MGSQDDLVIIQARLQPRHSVGARDLFSRSIQVGSSAHPASCSVGIGPPSPGAKWPGHSFNHLSPCNAEVNEWSCTYTPPPSLCGVNRENLPLPS
jgi:hypothetical protein